MTEEPLGTWLCPSCSPNAAFYIKQLVKTRAAPKEAATAASSKEKDPKPEAKKQKVVKKGVAVKKPAPKKLKLRNAGWVDISDEEEEEVLTPKPKKAANPASSKGKGKEDRPETNTKPTANKGIAVKKPTAETPKPKWKGWQELPSDDEEEFKKQVDAKWTDDLVKGKRKRTSKALAEETSRGSRRLRAPSRAGETKTEVENESDKDEGTDDGHSIYQQEEYEEEELEEEEEKASIDDASSDSDEDSDDSMDVDESSDHAEDRDGSMDMDLDQDDSVEASSSSRLSVVSIDREAAGSSSLPQQLTSATSPPGPSADSPQEYIIISDDDMDVEVEDEAQDHQGRVFGRVAQAVERNNHPALYPQRGNGWGYFRESAIRSTLPRLG